MQKNRYKVCVYAIAKNEEKFAKKWMDSMREADMVIVLDTGSTDKTVEILKAEGAKVFQEIITPWRFDVARNKALDLIPEDVDICVSTDLDELMEPSWRKNLEKAWGDDVKQILYRYTWSFDKDGNEGSVFYMEQIHARKDFKWVNPVHECLEYTGTEPQKKVFAEGVQLNHYPDTAKRRNYLPLLELSVKERPDDDRNVHYLGREYMYNGQWGKCIETLINHLNLPSANWKDERAASMRFIAFSYENLNQYDEAFKWYLKAIVEAPYLREPYIDCAKFFYNLHNWLGCAFMCESALGIKERNFSYANDPVAWGFMPYDLCSIAYYYLGLYEKAYNYVNIALSENPDDKRILENKKLIEEKL